MCEISAKLWEVYANSARILKVKWTSSDPKVIRLFKEEMDGAYGTLIGVALGKATIKAEITIVTSSQIFTKEASIEFEVKPDFEMKIAPSVCVVTGDAIQTDGWDSSDSGKTAFKLLKGKDKVTLTQNDTYNTADRIVFDNFTVNTQETIAGLKTVTLAKDAGYGFVIQDENITDQTFQIPISVKTRTDLTSKVGNYTAVVTVTVKKEGGELNATYEVGNVQRSGS